MKIKEFWKDFVENINWDGLRCNIKGDPSFREIMGAFDRQKEIDKRKKEQ